MALSALVHGRRNSLKERLPPLHWQSLNGSLSVTPSLNGENNIYKRLHDDIP